MNSKAPRAGTRGVSRWVPPGGEERLRKVLAAARAGSPVWRERLDAAGLGGAATGAAVLGGVEAGGGGTGAAGLGGVEAGAAAPGGPRWQALPVLRKESLGAVQAESPPFGGLLAVPVEHLARIFVSPGDIYDPQGADPDYWRFSKVLAAAGFRPGERVLNCFSYHLTPAGFMFDAAARALGCVVVPAGVGQQDLQIRVARAVGATGYVGLPSYLLALLERAAEAGPPLPIRRAVVTGEPLPQTLRERIKSHGVAVCQAYGTADVGLIAYECEQGGGMHLDEDVIVEICDPDGRPVPVGEMGEVVVTPLQETYPLLRFGTGDLSAMVAEPCPCGRPSLRLKGWLGRVSDVTKVRGIFLYPRQLEEALAHLAGGIDRWRAVVERDADHRDVLRIEFSGQADPRAVREAVQAAVRLNPDVVVVPAGALPADGPHFQDRRTWD